MAHNLHIVRKKPLNFKENNNNNNELRLIVK